MENIAATAPQIDMTALLPDFTRLPQKRNDISALLQPVKKHKVAVKSGQFRVAIQKHSEE